MSLIADTLPLPAPVPTVLALGAFLKNTICIMQGDRAYLSHVHGDLGTPDAIESFEQSVHGLLKELRAQPVWVAHDLHPDFHSTRFAEQMGLPCLPVQHHHAHAAAIAVDYGITAPVIGLSLDGFGLGPDQQSWGGELLWCHGPQYRRLGHLSLLPQPGGDRAAREPWRMAAAALHVLGRGDQIAHRWSAYPPAAMLAAVMAKKLNSPLTSSAGRLFDAACGLLNIHPVAEFEGQAPMALEKLVQTPRLLPGGWLLQNGILDFSPLLAHLADLEDAILGADLFHGTLIDGFAHWAQWAAGETGVSQIALGGGCFFNAVLRAGLTASLSAMGLTPLCARRLSPGDPGLSAGQAWIAAHAGWN